MNMLSLLLAMAATVNMLGEIPQIVSDTPSENSFTIAARGNAPQIIYSSTEWPGVVRAAGDLRRDIEAVTSCSPKLVAYKRHSAEEIVVGTLGRSKLIDDLASRGLLDVTPLKGKWESYVITTVENPWKGCGRALVIAGSDKRGTIYGIYELSQQLGVSPWYWWADVPVQHRASAYVKAGTYASGEPKVKYRGLFINDENPCMQRWARAKFEKGMGSEMYAHMFELILRLKGNLLWPGMWGSFKEYLPLQTMIQNEDGTYEGNAFNLDDPENPRLADEYGVVVGTSHHEPMQRSQQEWLRNKQNYGNGEWNWLTNKEAIKRFFTEGIEHTKNYESLITMGMRGDEDRPMTDAGSAEANFRVLEEIMGEQRRIIEQVTGKPASETPQVWTLYSEVLEYYDQGMHVPDDMIIMLCDDNWGDVRRLPEPGQPKHPGGYGMYYHVGYYGAPRASKWLNVTQLQQMQEQLRLTYDYGVDKLWLLNVGHLKPNEYPTDMFFRMAWDPTKFGVGDVKAYSEQFCAQTFGAKVASEAADILNTYCKYASLVTPEMLDDRTYSLENGEFEQMRDRFAALEARALRLQQNIPSDAGDAYNQLVLYPVQALANVYDMYYSLALNKYYARKSDARANIYADRVNECYDRDSLLTYAYNNTMSDGKWNHMMDQVHIGYTNWHGPQFNIRPRTMRIAEDKIRRGGYIFREQNGVATAEAEHYWTATAAPNTDWETIPDLGRALSGLYLEPETEPAEGAGVSYRFQMEPGDSLVTVHMYFDSTMPFLKGGHNVEAGFEGQEFTEINLNSDLTWKNNYSKMYPTGAARQIEKTLRLTLPSDDCVFTIRPKQPGIILLRLSIDHGGYRRSFLGMPESPQVQ